MGIHADLRARAVSSCTAFLAATLSITLVPGCAERSPASSASESASASSPSTTTPKVSSWVSPDLTSGLGIPARQRFIFAGGQDRGFEARAFNRGSVPVTICCDLDSVIREVAVIAPGEAAVAGFAAREAALFESPSDIEAAAKVEIWGEANVATRYIDLPRWCVRQPRPHKRHKRSSPHRLRPGYCTSSDSLDSVFAPVPERPRKVRCESALQISRASRASTERLHDCWASARS